MPQHTTSSRRTLLLGVLVSLAFTGCADLLNLLQASAAGHEPSFSFKTANITDVSLGGLTLDTVWTLSNPNDVSISLASVDYALFIENKQVVSGAPQQGLTIPALGSTDLHFPANLKFADLAGVVETFLTKDRASWRAEGGLGVQTPLGLIRVPVSKSGDFEVPKVPQVQFGNPRVSNLSLMGATIEFPLQVTNRSSYPLPVSGIVGTVSVAGANVGQLSTGNLGALDGKGTRTVTLPLNISFLSAAGAVVSAVQSGQAPVKFDASVQSGAQQVPLKVEQLVNFLK